MSGLRFCLRHLATLALAAGGLTAVLGACVVADHPLAAVALCGVASTCAAGIAGIAVQARGP